LFEAGEIVLADKVCDVGRIRVSNTPWKLADRLLSSDSEEVVSDNEKVIDIKKGQTR